MLGQLGVPLEILRAVNATPVPVGIHDPADEVGIVDAGYVGVVDLLALGGDHQGDVCGSEAEERRDLHAGRRVRKGD